MNERSEKLRHPFFSDMKVEEGAYLPFSYEERFYQGDATEEPWDEIEQFIPLIYRNWDELKEKIRSAQQQRNKQEAIRQMVIGVALLVQTVYWLNEKPVRLDKEPLADKLEWLPVNFTDRLHFIMAQPGLHLAFLQLVELMNELQKLYAKKMIRKKHSKQ